MRQYFGRYGCSHGSYNERERKACPYCKRDRERLEGDQKACSDCEAYAPLTEMVTKADGRVICRACQVKVERITADRAQATLFDNQLTMF